VHSGKGQKSRALIGTDCGGCHLVPGGRTTTPLDTAKYVIMTSSVGLAASLQTDRFLAENAWTPHSSLSGLRSTTAEFRKQDNGNGDFKKPVH